MPDMAVCVYWETRAQLIDVRTHQWIGFHHADQIQVVGDQHHIARYKIRVHASRGVGYKHHFQPEAQHHTNRQGDLRHTVALIEMYPSLHHEDRLTFQLANDQLPGVAMHGRNRPIWQIPIRDRLRILNGVGQTVQPGTENHSDTRAV